ncbi:MAG TPA: Gldg family protein, partial [Limnochorda sp.]
GGRSRRVEPANLYSYGTRQTQLEFRGEQAITRALVELAREQSMKVYFLTGHGELTPADRLGTLASYLEGEGYTVGSLNVAQVGKIPDDATVLVAVGPQSDLSEQERETIQAYLEQGGRLMLLMDPSTRSITGWNTLAEGLGVRFRNDVVVDPAQSFFLDPLSPMPTLRYHDITKDLQERQMRVMLPGARSLERLGGDQTPYRVTTLLESSFDAWGETTLQGTTLRKDDADTPGPLDLAVAVTRPVAPATAEAGEGSAEAGEAGEEAQATTTQEPVAVVMGNASFVDGQMLGIQGNQDFFLNALNWLVGEEHLISIRPKVLDTPTVQLTPALIRQVFYGFVVALPLAVLLAGGVVWWRRRAL